MDTTEIDKKFKTAFDVAEFSRGRLTNPKEVERLMKPALDALGYYIQQSKPFLPPYRLEETKEGVFLIPHLGDRMSIADIPLYNGVAQIKSVRQNAWESGIHSYLQTINDHTLRNFVFSFLGNNRLGVKFRKQTGHFAISEVVNTLQAHYDTIDPEARSLAGRVYARLTYGRYAEVKRRRAEFLKFDEEGAMGARHLFPGIKKHGFSDLIDSLCTPQTHLALKEKGIRYLYNIFDEIDGRMNSDVHVVEIGSGLNPHPSDQDKALIAEIKERIFLTIDGINQVVKMTGQLPPEPLVLSFFKLSYARHNKAFVAASTLFSEGRQRMRDLLALGYSTLVSASNEDRVDVNGFRAIVNRKIDFRLAAERKSTSLSVGDVTFVYPKKNTLLAYYQDPKTGLIACKKMKKDFLDTFQDNRGNGIEVKDVIDAAGFLNQASMDRIQSRPSCLFSLIRTGNALKFYASTPQGKRMLSGKEGTAFLKRVAVAAIRRFDTDLLRATLDALASRNACLHPEDLQAGSRAWLMKGESGEMLSLVLSQPSLSGEASRCFGEKWLEEALSSQASPRVAEIVIAHLNGGVTDKTVALFDNYHVQTDAFNSFIHACKMRAEIDDEAEGKGVVSNSMSGEAIRARPAFARTAC